MSSETPVARRPTIMEVARLAGVSHQTVSRFLRFDGGMKEATRERISAAIAELDYRPNLVARAMRDRKTGRLALLLPAGSAVSSLEMLAGAAEAAEQAGYVVEGVTVGGPHPALSERALELADSGMFEGIVALTPLPVASIRPGASRTPIVVSPDYDEGMRGIGELADASRVGELIDGLVRLGHRTFLHLAGDYVHASARCRKQVYLETIEQRGLRSYGVVDCDWSADRARLAVLALPARSGVTAIIGANDVVAAGAVRGAIERGWRVPDDVSVTGWDNDPVAAMVVPSMTTVEVDHEKLGRRAITRLLAVLRGEPVPDEHDSITEIIWRESTGPAPD